MSQISGLALTTLKTADQLILMMVPLGEGGTLFQCDILHKTGAALVTLRQ